MSAKKQASRDANRGVAKRTQAGPAKPPAATDYVVTQRERDALSKLFEAAPVPSLKVSRSDDRVMLEPDHPIDGIGLALLLKSFGTTDPKFFYGVVDQLAPLTEAGGRLDGKQLNFILSIIDGVQPRDRLESLLAAQIAAVHMATMTLAGRLKNAETIPEQDSAERAFNKLARTMTTLIDALKRYRSGGEQKVTVQHVTVGEGGQAIVGNVTQARTEPGSKKTVAVAPALLTDAKAVPMPPIEESRTEVPITARRSENHDK